LIVVFRIPTFAAFPGLQLSLLDAVVNFSESPEKQKKKKINNSALRVQKKPTGSPNHFRESPNIAKISEPHSFERSLESLVLDEQAEPPHPQFCVGCGVHVKKTIPQNVCACAYAFNTNLPVL
jgi:hypothetical protein